MRCSSNLKYPSNPWQQRFVAASTGWRHAFECLLPHNLVLCGAAGPFRKNHFSMLERFKAAGLQQLSLQKTDR